MLNKPSSPVHLCFFFCFSVLCLFGTQLHAHAETNGSDIAPEYADRILQLTEEMKSSAPRTLAKDLQQLSDEIQTLRDLLDQYHSKPSEDNLEEITDHFEDVWDEYGDWRKTLQKHTGEQLVDSHEKLDELVEFQQREFQSLQSLLEGSFPSILFQDRSRHIGVVLDRIIEIVTFETLKQRVRNHGEYLRWISDQELKTSFRYYREDLSEPRGSRKISAEYYLSRVNNAVSKLKDRADTDSTDRLRLLGYEVQSQGAQLIRSIPSTEFDKNVLREINGIVQNLIPGQENSGEFGALH